jgi:hypothetical protein
MDARLVSKVPLSVDLSERNGVQLPAIGQTQGGGHGREYRKDERLKLQAGQF